MLPWAWAEERLLGRATTGSRRPARTPRRSGALWRDGTLLFSCGGESRKARELAQDPRLVVHLESGDDVVIVEGVAEPTTATVADVEAYEQKYAYRLDAAKGWYRVAPRRASPGARSTTRGARRGSTSKAQLFRAGPAEPRPGPGPVTNV